MNDSSGIQLALLEGMDESLLFRLYDRNIRTRSELEKLLATPEKRKELSERLQVSLARLEAIHHLNFLLPEERVGRLFDLEKALHSGVAEAKAENRGVKRLLGLLTVVTLGLAGALGYLWYQNQNAVPVTPQNNIATQTPKEEPPRRADPVTESNLEAELAEMKIRLDALAPLAGDVARANLHEALSHLGPSPGWNGPLKWSERDHLHLATNLGDDPTTEREKAVSLALSRLSAVENQNLTGPDFLNTALAAAGFVQEFPEVDKTESIWDAAARSVRLRLYSRALGLAPLQDLDLEATAETPWSWTAGGYIQAELLLARLESLPIQEEALPLWFETLAALKESANVGRDALAKSSEAWAREYWLLRADLELMVVATALGKTSLAPYYTGTPAAFLAKREAYLRRVLSRSPGEVHGPFQWLSLEFEEAKNLMAWLEANQEDNPALGKPWAQAIAALEGPFNQQRTKESVSVGPKVGIALMTCGLGQAEEPLGHARAKWEAGLRPLLIETRHQMAKVQ